MIHGGEDPVIDLAPVSYTHLDVYKRQTVYSTENPDLLVLEFRNDTSAGDGARIEQFDRKGMVNNLSLIHILTFVIGITEQGRVQHHVAAKESKGVNFVVVDVYKRQVVCGSQPLTSRILRTSE